MPHLTIEYSRNLELRVDIGALCALLSQTIMTLDLFELGAVRVRAFGADHFSIADGHDENCFLDMRFRMGAGRTIKDRERVGQALFAAAEDFLAELFQRPHFALSLEALEIDPALSWKKNAIHPRLRGTSGS